jgi:hypothetical protein
VNGLGEQLRQVSGVNLIIEPGEVREASLFWMARLSEKESPILHGQLKEALFSAMLEAKRRKTE